MTKTTETFNKVIILNDIVIKITLTRVKMLLELYSGEKERESGLNMTRVILTIQSGLFWVLTSTNTTLGCEYIALSSGNAENRLSSAFLKAFFVLFAIG